MAQPGYFAQGIYEVKNTDKYVGKTAPKYRSSWELAFMRMCDAHPNILQWASEAIRIPYINPVSQRKVNYIPDFLIVYKTISFVFVENTTNYFITRSFRIRGVTPLMYFTIQTFKELVYRKW